MISRRMRRLHPDVSWTNHHRARGYQPEGDIRSNTFDKAAPNRWHCTLKPQSIPRELSGAIPHTSCWWGHSRSLLPGPPKQPLRRHYDHVLANLNLPLELLMSSACRYTCQSAASFTCKMSGIFLKKIGVKVYIWIKTQMPRFNRIATHTPPPPYLCKELRIIKTMLTRVLHPLKNCIPITYYGTKFMRTNIGHRIWYYASYMNINFIYSVCILSGNICANTRCFYSCIFQRINYISNFPITETSMGDTPSSALGLGYDHLGSYINPKKTRK
jgi:hypothetical protein